MTQKMIREKIRAYATVLYLRFYDSLFTADDVKEVLKLSFKESLELLDYLLEKKVVNKVPTTSIDLYYFTVKPSMRL